LSFSIWKKYEEAQEGHRSQIATPVLEVIKVAPGFGEDFNASVPNSQVK